MPPAELLARRGPGGGPPTGSADRRGPLPASVALVLGLAAGCAPGDGAPARAAAAPLPARSYDVDPAELGAGEAAFEIAVFALAALEGLEGGPPSDLAGLHDEIVAALAAYLDGSREAFEAYARARDLEIGWVEELAAQGRLDALWAERSRTLRRAPLATAGVAVRPRVLRGVDLGVADAAAAVSVDRPGRIPWLPDVAAETVDVWEVLVPARVQARREGRIAPFDGRLGLRLAHERALARWVLAGLTIYDAPDGTSLGLPPL